MTSSLDYIDASEPRPQFSYKGPEDPRLSPQASGVAALKACLVGASHGADFAAQRVLEEECIRVHAVDRGWGLDSGAFSLARGRGKYPEVGAGNEHDVLFDPQTQRVIKITNNRPNFGAQGPLLDYITNLENHNELFADSLRFEGLLETNDGPVAVTSQPFIEGRAASESEIVEFFADLGFSDEGQHSFQRPDSAGRLLKAFDARPANVA